MPPDPQTALVARPLSGLPSRGQWVTIVEAAKALVGSGLLPKGIDTAQKAVAIILKGAELGIPPMHAFAHLVVINGKPSCSAELHLALLARGGVTWKWLKDGADGTAEIEFHRPGFPAPFVGRFSLEDARRAGLASNSTWEKYPGPMLRARAITAGARMFGADLLAGMSYTPEELGAKVDEDGEVVEVESAEEAEFVEVPEAPATRQHDEPEDLPFDSHADLLRTAIELEKQVVHKVGGWGRLHNARKKYADTTVLAQAETPKLRDYVQRLLEYEKEQPK